MSDPNARERAAVRLVEMLTPAAALGIECDLPLCRAMPGERCHSAGLHESRKKAARAELHALLLQLGLGE